MLEIPLLFGAIAYCSLFFFFLMGPPVPDSGQGDPLVIVRGLEKGFANKDLYLILRCL